MSLPVTVALSIGNKAEIESGGHAQRLADTLSVFGFQRPDVDNNRFDLSLCQHCSPAGHGSDALSDAAN